MELCGYGSPMFRNSGKRWGKERNMSKIYCILTLEK